jgi:hypothetical protein
MAVAWTFALRFYSCPLAAAICRCWRARMWLRSECVCMYACMYVLIDHISMYLCMYVCMHACVCMRGFVLCICIMCLCAYAWMHTHRHMYMNDTRRSQSTLRNCIQPTYIHMKHILTRILTRCDTSVPFLLLHVFLECMYICTHVHAHMLKENNAIQCSIHAHIHSSAYAYMRTDLRNTTQRNSACLHTYTWTYIHTHTYTQSGGAQSDSAYLQLGINLFRRILFRTCEFSLIKDTKFYVVGTRQSWSRHGQGYRRLTF